MDLTINVGLLGWLVLFAAAITLGLVVERIGRAGSGDEWLGTALGSLAGAIVTSEFVVSLRAVGPVFDGLALVPALVGGLVVGLVVAWATRLYTGGSFHAPSAT